MHSQNATIGSSAVQLLAKVQTPEADAIINQILGSFSGNEDEFIRILADSYKFGGEGVKEAVRRNLKDFFSPTKKGVYRKVEEIAFINYLLIIASDLIRSHDETKRAQAVAARNRLLAVLEATIEICSAASKSDPTMWNICQNTILPSIKQTASYTSSYRVYDWYLPYLADIEHRLNKIGAQRNLGPRIE